MKILPLKIIQNTKKQQLNIYSNEAQHAIALWNNRNSKNPQNQDINKIAFDLILSIANIIRFSGESDKLTIIKNLPSDERKELSLAALDYISNSSLKNDVKKIINLNNDYENDEIELFEDYLQTRDNFQIVWDFIKQITSDFIEKDDDLLKKYTLTRCFLAEIDELLAERMDIVAVASRSLELVRDMSKIELNKTDYWWLYEARDYDNKFEKILTNFFSLLNFLNIASKSFTFVSEKPKYEPQAAKSEKFSYLLVWNKSVSELRKYFKNNGKISETADLDDYIRKIDTEFSASWFVNSTSIKTKAPVLIIATDTNKFLATAEFYPDTQTIVLDNVLNKKTFENYMNKPERLLLVVFLNQNA